MHKEDIVKNAKFYKHYLYKWAVYIKGQNERMKEGPFLIEEITVDWLDVRKWKSQYDMRYILRHKYDTKYTASVTEDYIITGYTPTYYYNYRYDPTKSIADMYPVKSAYTTLEEYEKRMVERIEASPIRIDVDDKSKSIEEIKKMVNYTFGVSKFEYKKIIFNGPCTIILWKDGTKTIAKASDGEMFDPEKGVAICFMKRVLGETEGKKVLRKANKDFYDEVSREANRQLDEELRKATFPLPKGVTFRPFNFDGPITHLLDNNNKVIKVAKEKEDDN